MWNSASQKPHKAGLPEGIVAKINLIAGIAALVLMTGFSFFLVSSLPLKHVPVENHVSGFASKIESLKIGTPGIMTDLRDGKTYKIITLAGKTWMAENLNYSSVNSWWPATSSVSS